MSQYNKLEEVHYKYLSEIKFDSNLLIVMVGTFLYLVADVFN